MQKEARNVKDLCCVLHSCRLGIKGVPYKGIFFKREKASACASSDHFFVLSYLPLSLISSHIPNNVTNYKNLGKQEATIDFGNENNELSLEMLIISRI